VSSVVATQYAGLIEVKAMYNVRVIATRATVASGIVIRTTVTGIEPDLNDAGGASA
jgi:hypothetical protein